MIYNPQLHHRRSIRLQGYDYSQAGAYYVTICTYRRECFLTFMEGDEMVLNTLGCIIEEAWLKTPQIRQGVELDEFVIMPNHFHAIVVLPSVGAHSCAPLPPQPKLHRSPKSLGSLVAGFKSVTTTRINYTLKTFHQPRWQRNYYEHIIRDEADLDRIREYIVNNPAKWAEDDENPDRKKP